MPDLWPIEQPSGDCPHCGTFLLHVDNCECGWEREPDVEEFNWEDEMDAD